MVSGRAQQPGWVLQSCLLLAHNCTQHHGGAPGIRHAHLACDACMRSAGCACAAQDPRTARGMHACMHAHRIKAGGACPDHWTGQLHPSHGNGRVGCCGPLGACPGPSRLVPHTLPHQLFMQCSVLACAGQGRAGGRWSSWSQLMPGTITTADTTSADTTATTCWRRSSTSTNCGTGCPQAGLA